MPVGPVGRPSPGAPVSGTPPLPSDSSRSVSGSRTQRSLWLGHRNNSSSSVSWADCSRNASWSAWERGATSNDSAAVRFINILTFVKLIPANASLTTGGGIRRETSCPILIALPLSGKLVRQHQSDLGRELPAVLLEHLSEDGEVGQQGAASRVPFSNWVHYGESCPDSTFTPINVGIRVELVV